MWFNGTRRGTTISGDTVDEVEHFKYFGSFVPKDGGFDENVKQD